jgi:hypothetical protein
MKTTTFLALLIGLFLLPAGTAMADTGVNATTETQGISITTSIIAVGSFKSSSSVDWDGGGYQAGYTEKTMSNGVGQIAYEKSLTIDTSAALNGQSNIEAVKLLTFTGEDGAHVYSDESIMVSGSGSPGLTENAAICVFAAPGSEYIPAFCNHVLAGSTVSGGFINMQTVSDTRFIVPSADTPVALNHHVTVSPITIVDAAGVMQTYPSVGDASAFMEGLIMEGRGNDIISYGTMEFAERTSVSGDIYKFDKNMHYESGFRRVREA